MNNTILPLEELQYFGIDIKNLTEEQRQQLECGQVTDITQLKVPYSFEMETYLNQKEVDYRIQNDEIVFDARIKFQPQVTIDNTEENKRLLKINNIHDFKVDDNKIKLKRIEDIDNFNTLLFTTLNPLVSLALILIFKTKRPNLEDKNLSKEEIEGLERGEVIKHDFGKGKGAELLQVDPKTNSLVAISVNAISIPNKVLGVELSPIQKEQLRNGQTIEIKTEDEKKIYISVDLTKGNGLVLTDESKKEIKMSQIEDMEKKRRFLYDLYDDSVMDTISTDENKNKYIEYIKKNVAQVQSEGFDAIEKIHPNESLKQQALAKYLNIEKEYKEYRKLQEELKQNNSISMQNNIEFELNRTNDTIKSKATNKLNEINQISETQTQSVKL